MWWPAGRVARPDVSSRDPIKEAERMNPKDVLKLAKEKGARIVDLRFIDLPGMWQHFSIPASELSEGIFEYCLGFDGSSIRGFQSIDEYDILLISDPSTSQMDPISAVPTLLVVY